MPFIKIKTPRLPRPWRDDPLLAIIIVTFAILAIQPKKKSGN